jgi:hypothetical protein
MNNSFPSLITSDAKAGLELAGNLADQLQTVNYLLPAPVPKEITASILFFAIAAANQGWPTKT